MSLSLLGTFQAERGLGKLNLDFTSWIWTLQAQIVRKPNATIRLYAQKWIWAFQTKFGPLIFLKPCFSAFYFWHSFSGILISWNLTVPLENMNKWNLKLFDVFPSNSDFQLISLHYYVTHYWCNIYNRHNVSVLFNLIKRIFSACIFLHEKFQSN